MMTATASRDAQDFFQLDRGAAFNLPLENELFSDQLDAQGRSLGYLGLGFTGLINNGAANPNWQNWLDKTNQGPNPNDILGGAVGAITVNMTGGTAFGTANNQEKGYQFGVNVSTTTGTFTVESKLINFSDPFQLYHSSPGAELGIFMGTGSQSDYIKLVINQQGIAMQAEVNDVPGNPISRSIAIAERPSSLVLMFEVNPSNGQVLAKYQLDNKPIQILGTLLAQGVLLNAIQQNNLPVGIGIIGTSNNPATEVQGTWDYFRVLGNAPSIIYRINAGDVQITATDEGPDWAANATAGAFTGTGFTVNSGNISTHNIAGRDASVPAYVPQSIFAKERWDPPAAPEMQWSFDVSPGNYEVRLYMGNGCSCTSAVGQRVFDIKIEGQLVENDLDLVTAFGHQVGGMKSYQVNVADQSLDILFEHVVEIP
ncbi:MAG: hypothetical protein HC913_23755 [Microscillaceae bacterium]|nr:hypothetical protein [Microscillaceae bacterium]